MLILLHERNGEVTDPLSGLNHPSHGLLQVWVTLTERSSRLRNHGGEAR